MFETLKKRLRIDFSKNTKLTYYLINGLKLLVPDFYYRNKLNKALNAANSDEYIQSRVNYYNKVDDTFQLDETVRTIKEFKKEKKKTYFFDLIEFLRYFPSSNKIAYLFGDITTVPDQPTILKSRPILGNNKNSVLMKLNKIRHFIFVNDTVKFEDKKDKAVWRGKCYIPHRVTFVKQFYDSKLCDIGQTNSKDDVSVPWQKGKLSLKEQLQYKFVVAIEGNDVASNLKWVMSSNSIAIMAKPKYETWFMEGSLIPNYHYILVKDDYSDLEEKIEYYAKNIDISLEIINNAHTFVEQFKDNEREKLISLSVIDKYLECQEK